MKRAGVISHGTARDLAEKGEGYAANGLSEHSRHAAHSQNIKLPSYQANVRKIRGPKSSAELIEEATKALAKLQRDARSETNPVRLAKLRKNVEIKTRFIKILEQNRHADALKQPRRTGRVVEDGVLRDEETGARVSFSMGAAHGEQIERGDIVDYVAIDTGRNSPAKALRVWMNIKLLT